MYILYIYWNISIYIYILHVWLMQRKLLGGFEAPFRHRFVAARTAHRESWGMSEPQGHLKGPPIGPFIQRWSDESMWIPANFSSPRFRVDWVDHRSQDVSYCGWKKLNHQLIDGLCIPLFIGLKNHPFGGAGFRNPQYYHIYLVVSHSIISDQISSSYLLVVS